MMRMEKGLECLMILSLYAKINKQYSLGRGVRYIKRFIPTFLDADQVGDSGKGL